MARSKEYELSIKIAGEIAKSFNSSVNLTKKELAAIAKEASLTSKSTREAFNYALKDMEPLFGGLENAAKVGFKALSTAAMATAATVTTIGVAAANVGIEYESAFAGVKKTTDATALEYEKLSNGILEMADNIPASAASIAEVAEGAGQLGIAKEHLLDFSEVMINMGEATNLSATDASTSLAKFANITNMSADNYSNLGSVIVALGNNFATTEADIVAMATRLAATGELTGLSQANTMALATAMSSVGIEAEAGGSAMSKLLKKIQVATELGGSSLEEYAKVANMSASDFKKAFGEDAVGALGSFLSGLNDTERNGMSAIAILNDMGLKEANLSNTILSLANASGVMTDAVTTANEAWEENTALSNEVAQRYATTESQISIMKNKIKGIGIDMYYDFQGPLRDIVYLFNDELENIGNTVENSNFIEGMTKHVPTLKREFKEAGETILEFADPFISVAEYFIENSELIVGGIAGIGGALAAYKVEKGIAGLTKTITGFVSKLNPMTVGLSAATLAVGAVVGVAAGIKKANAEMKRQNLSEHFGNISLSLSELEEVAEHIIYNDSLGKLSEAMNAYKNLDSINSSIDSAVQSLNKANWKVSIGMELNESDREEYISNIQKFVEQSQQALVESQYAMSINLDILTDNDAAGEAIRNKFNSFYDSQSAELSDLGTKLSEAVNSAFEDDLLTIDEAKEIAELQQQMAAITEKMASSRFDAKMEVLGMQYSGGELDAESFKNLQDEIKTQVEAYKSSLNESLEMNIANASVMLDEKEIDKTEYDVMIAEFKANYLEQLGDIELKATSFQTNTIMEQYSDELEAAIPGLKEKLNSALSDATNYVNYDNDNMALMWQSLFDNVEEFEGLDKTTRAAIGELFVQLQPSVEQLEELKRQYENAGIEIPYALLKGISDANALGALADNDKAIWSILGSGISNSTEYTAMVNKLKEMGATIPSEVTNSMFDNEDVIRNGIVELHGKMKQDLISIMSTPIDVQVPVNVTYSTNTSDYKGALNPNGATKTPFNSLGGHADGGIFDTPHIAWFAEEGPEAAIPLDGSQNAINLWKTAGEMLGIYQNEDSSKLDLSLGEAGENTVTYASGAVDGTQHNESSTITFNPTYQFYGGTPTKDDLLEAGRISQEDFVRMYEQYIKDNERYAFS